MDIDSEHLGIPETEYEATVKIPSSEFKRIMNDLSSIGDQGSPGAHFLCGLAPISCNSSSYCIMRAVTISVTKDGVRFSASGDIGEANINVRPQGSSDKEDQTQIDLNEPVSLTFAIRYLNSFSKAQPLANMVTLSMSKELPIAVEFKVQDMGYVRYFLAPKVSLLYFRRSVSYPSHGRTSIIELQTVHAG